MDAYDEYLQSVNKRLQGGEPLSNYGAVASTAGKAAEATPFPVVQAAGLGIDTVGKILGAYGAYQDAEDQKKEAAKVQTHDWARQAIIDAQAAEEAKRREEQAAGQYAQGSLDDVRKNYGGFNRATGR